MADLRVDDLEAAIGDVTAHMPELTDEDLAVIDDAAGDLKSSLRSEQNRRRSERHKECVTCGLTSGDLPDGVDPEFVFATDDGETRCHGCAGGGRA